MSVLDMRMFIGGHWVESASGERLSVYNPARAREVVGTVPAGTADDVHAAVAAAKQAQRGWGSMTLGERATYLQAGLKALNDIDTAAPELLTREMGKALWESSTDFQFPDLAWRVYLDDLGSVERLLKEQRSDAYGDIFVDRVPVGVVGAIVPWNWPVTLMAIKIGPGLLAGNTMVVVPSPLAPLGLLKAVEAVGEALPPGVLNVVTGLGDRVGAPLTQHPDVAMVSFTGGVETGRVVGTALGEHLKKGVFELGGNDPAILLDDVEITDDLAQTLVNAFCTTSGQLCFAVKRLYVHEAIYLSLLDALSEALGQVVVGDGLDPDVTMGPLVSEGQARRFDEMLARASARGATVREYGVKHDPERWGEGHFHLPKLVTDVSHDEDIVMEEQFAPALPVLRFSSEDEVIRMANSTQYGLTSSVWSSDRARARGVAGRLEAGTTFINMHNLLGLDPASPFGGVKKSGFGRELGKDGLLEFTSTHQINDRHFLI